MEKKNPGISDHFPEETEYPPWFFKISVGTKIKCAFKLSSANNKKKSKNNFFDFFRATIIYNIAFP